MPSSSSSFHLPLHLQPERSNRLALACLLSLLISFLLILQSFPLSSITSTSAPTETHRFYSYGSSSSVPVRFAPRQPIGDESTPVQIAPPPKAAIFVDGSSPVGAESPAPVARSPTDAIFEGGSPPIRAEFPLHIALPPKAAIFQDGSSPIGSEFPVHIALPPKASILGGESPSYSPALKAAIFGYRSSPIEAESPVQITHPPKASISGDGPPSSSPIGRSSASKAVIFGDASAPIRAETPVQTAFQQKPSVLRSNSPPSLLNEQSSVPRTSIFAREKKSGRCDLYSGKWVKDLGGEYPLYAPWSCPFVDAKFACKENGRKDGEYMRWRWKPDGCDLPRFNATDLLEMLRGKVMIFVGDSMSRNEYESMLCLLRKSNETADYRITKNRGFFRMRFPEYNCSVEYHRSYYLVRRGVRVDGSGKSWPTLQIDRIDESADRWRSADVLIFNTGHWWTRAKTNGGKNFYQEGDIVYSKLGNARAYKRSLQTWAAWVEKNLTPRRNTIFLRGLGNSHFSGGGWDTGGACDKDTDPVSKGRILNKNPWQTKVIKEVVQGMRYPVIFLDVTRMTNFRKDAHPSLYGDAAQMTGQNSSTVQDCSHWCLPGVPDAWNELLYANILSQRLSSL